MNVLYAAYRLPHPPDKGERIRMFHQIRHLRTRGDVHLVCPVRRGDSERSKQAMEELCSTVSWVPDSGLKSATREIARLMRGGPRSVGTHCPSGARRAAQAIVKSKDVDVAFASTVYMADCLRSITSVPRVMDFVDVYSEVWRGRSADRDLGRLIFDRLEADRLRHLEARVAESFDRVVLVSAAEAARFRSLVSDVDVAVVGNGVDLEYFRPDSDRTRADVPTIVFTGTMGYEPNIEAVRWFCDGALPIVQRRVPEAELQIVGRDPAPAVQRLSRRSGVTVTGAVDDIRPFLAKASVAIAPLQDGFGLPNKILEALAMGLPVVASSVALAGIDAEGSEALIPAEDAQDFADAVADVLAADPVRRSRLSGRARAYVESRHRWEDVGSRLSSALEDLASGHREQPGA